LVVADLASDMTAGVELGAEVIDDGRAAKVLDAFIETSQAVASAGGQR
jgi:anthranilate phosphoribosyltransferase